MGIIGDTIVVKETSETLFKQRLHFLQNNPRVAPPVLSVNDTQRTVTTVNLATQDYYDMEIKEISAHPPAERVAFLNALFAMFNELDGRYQDILVPGNYAVRRNADGTYDVRMYEAGKFLGRGASREDDAKAMFSHFLSYFCASDKGGKKLLGGAGSKWHQLYASLV